MNKVILMGRLARDPEVRYSQGENSTAVARYTLAVDRRFKREGDQTADFIGCVAFGKNAEFAEKYLHKGTKICAEGRIQTGSYTNRDGQKVYTTDVIIEAQEFAESKGAGGVPTGAPQAQPQAAQAQAPIPAPTPAPAPTQAAQPQFSDTGFMQIPEGIDEELPFN